MPFVIDHMGRVKADGGLEQRPFRALLDLMKLDNCWVKVCGAERVSTAARLFSTPFRSPRRSSMRLPTGCCGARTGPTPTSAASCRTTAIWSISSAEIAPDEVQREKLLVQNPANLYGWA